MPEPQFFDLTTDATPRWDRHFLQAALLQATMSKDPSTQVGAVIVGPDRRIRATGFNGFPRGIADTPQRLNDRDTKLGLVVHAELNALLSAAAGGPPVGGCRMYVAALGAGRTGGIPPCSRCAAHLIQGGITEVVTWEHVVPERYTQDAEAALAVLEEGGVAYRAVEMDSQSARFIVDICSSASINATYITESLAIANATARRV